MKKKFLALVLTLAMVLSLVPMTALAEEPAPVAQIGEVTYSSIDTAIEQAEAGATIKLLQDVTPTKTFSKSLTFTGGHAINFNVYGWRYTGALVLDGAHLNIINGESSRQADNGEAGRWFTMCLTGSITAKNQADISFVIDSNSGATCAIYMDEHTQSSINVESGSRFSITGENTKGKAGQGIQLGNPENTGIYVSGNSEFLIDGTNRGYVNSPEIKVEDSTFTVKNCTSNASNSGNFTAVNSTINFENNAVLGLSVNSLNSINSTFHLNRNGYSGLVIKGNSNIDGTSKVYINGNCKDYYSYGAFFCGAPTTFKSGSTLEVCENGANGIRVFSGPARTIGYCPTSTGSLTVEEGAKLTIKENRAYRTTSAVGDDLGGAIWNNSTVSIPKNAEIYNNHAEKAGDDIYNTGKITFGDVGEGWVLDDCNHDINGWYDDGEGSRWTAHNYPSYICQFNEFDKESGLATLDYEVALKAAHDVIQEDPIQPDSDRAHSKSKEATNLVKQSDGTYTSDVTLTLPSVEEDPVYDVVFVLDKSTSVTLKDQAKEMLQKLQNQIAGTRTTIKVGVVIFDQKAKTTDLIDLTTGYTELKNAIQQTTSSGTNTHAGLLAGKELLDNDTDVAADHKYLIFVSDGITYMYNAEPTAIALQDGDQTKTDGSDAFAAPDNWPTKYESNDAPGNWKTWLEGISTLIQTDKDTYELPYAQTASGLQKTKWLPYIEKMNHATSVDKALYLTNEAYQSAKTAGYHCYAMEAEGTAGKDFPWGPSFINYLAGGKEVSFEDIHNDIYYLLSEGSTVEDVIGYGTDNRGNAYNFDFVNDMSKLTLKVGTETLEATDLSLDLSYGDANETARYGFAPNRVQITTDTDQSNIPEQAPYSYDYVLHYYQNGKDGKSDECFVWDINVPVSKFAPVSLTYQVKLTNAQTSSGTYGTYDKNGSQNKDSLYTNKSATLYPVDSNQDYGTPENFLKPTVSYTVSGGDGGSHKPTVTIPDDVPTGLNGKDHYA